MRAFREFLDFLLKELKSKQKDGKPHWCLVRGSFRLSAQPTENVPHRGAFSVALLCGVENSACAPLVKRLGHESLRIIRRFTPQILSVLDPGSAFRHPFGLAASRPAPFESLRALQKLYQPYFVRLPCFCAPGGTRPDRH